MKLKGITLFKRNEKETKSFAMRMLLPIITFALLLSGSLFSQTQTFNSSGTFTIPAGVTSITVEAWGAGGRGGLRTSGNPTLAGGGGGAYSRSVLTVTPGATYTVTVGAGSTSTSAGGDSWFRTTGTLLAKGGGSVSNNSNTSGSGGAASSGVGTIKYSGGNGAEGPSSFTGGGGGSSAGTAQNGVYTNTTTETNNGATAPTGGGNGGDGGASGEEGEDGIAPGGGGGGGRGRNTRQDPGNGANGRVVITWIQSDLQVTKTVNRTRATIGSTVVFTVTASNNGPSNVAGVKVQDLLPTGFTYVSHTVSAGVLGDYIPGTGVWTIGTFNNGASRILSITATFNGGVNNTNTATITAENYEEANPPNNTASATVTLPINTENFCYTNVPGNTFAWTRASGSTPNPYTESITQPGTNGGFVFDIIELDNSFNMNINGVLLATQELEFQIGPGTLNIQFQDGSYWGNGTVPQIYNLTGTSAYPLIRVNIDINGNVTMFGSKTSGGPLFPLVLTNGNSFNYIPWNSATSNNIIVSQTITGPTVMNGLGYGQNVVGCAVDAVNDSFNILFSGGTTTSVLANDLHNGGAPGSATTSNVNITTVGTWPTGITLNANGTITVAPGTTQGSYPLEYRICTIVTPSNCDNAIVTIQIFKDSDGDGIPDNVDLDNDNDGILDSVEGRCATSSSAATDGFDNPTVPLLNANNIQTGSTYNGWTAINPTTSALVPNAFNILKVNGTSYLPGPDNAHSGNQYVDINSTDAIVYKQFTLSTPTVFSASAFFANRDTQNGTYAAWNSKIEIINTTTSALVSGNVVSFTKAMGNEGWFESKISNIALPAGTYRIRMYVSNDGHLDSITYCFSRDTDGDSIPDYLDLDSDNDGCFDAIEGDENVLPDHLNEDGSINTATTGGVSSDGVPNLVNSGGAADIGGDKGQGIGTSRDAALNGCFCYLPGVKDVGVLYPSLQGITSLSRSGIAYETWLKSVKQSAWSVLESKTKGFVINRVKFNPSNKPVADNGSTLVITTPIEGMMVYDTTNNCLKLYTSIDNGVSYDWYCLETQTCPDN